MDWNIGIRIFDPHLSHIPLHLETCDPLGIVRHISRGLHASYFSVSRIGSPVFNELLEGVFLSSHAAFEDIDHVGVTEHFFE